LKRSSKKNPKCIEAKTVLGTLYAHEVLSAIPRVGFSAAKEDITDLHKKAIYLLEGVRNVWKNDKRTDPVNEAVLLTLARLYEHDQSEKSLQCLQAVHQIYLEVKENDDVVIPLQLINNMATLYWYQEQYDKARELYQQALSSIPEAKKLDENLDTDALATTLTFNLGRCEEAACNPEEAKSHYNQLLQYHDDYVDANMRLTYMALRNASPDGPSMIAQLMQTDGNNLEVRALYGWYLSKQKRKTPFNIAEDIEQRHYKHTLQNHDKHDRFSLTGMGNLYLHTAREMRRDNEPDKEKRRKTYEKAVEFFDKCLQLDPKNAYAAQGIAIALVEDKKDLRGAVGIFSKVRETLVHDGHAVVNFGHCLAGLEQWGRAIEMVSIFFHIYHHVIRFIPICCLPCFILERCMCEKLLPASLQDVRPGYARRH
jgi:RNA polymerase-associated protein CTR9